MTKGIKLKKTINQHLLFRDSSYTLSASRLRAYYLLQRQYLLFRSSSHMLLANKLRVYHLLKKKPAVRRALCVLLLLKKNILSFKKGTRSILLTLTHLLLHQNFRKKWAKQLPLSKDQHCLLLPNSDSIVDCNHVFCLPTNMMLLYMTQALAQRYPSSVYNRKENLNIKAKLYSRDIQMLHLL